MLQPPNPIAKQIELNFRHHVTEAICLMCVGLGAISVIIPLIYRTVSPISGIVFTIVAGTGYYLARFRRRSDIAAYGIVAILMASSVALSFVHGVYGALALFLIVLSIVVAGLIVSTRLGIVVFLLQLSVVIPLVSRQTAEDVLSNHSIDMVPDMIMSVCIGAIIVLLIHFYTQRMYHLYSERSTYQKKLSTYTNRIENVINARKQEVMREAEMRHKRLEQLATLGKELSTMSHDMGNALTALRLVFDQNREKFGQSELDQIDTTFSHIETMLTLPRQHRSSLATKASLTTCLDQCEAIMRRRLAREGISLTMAADDAYVALSEDTLKKILLNLISNSIDALKDFGRENKTITISGSNQDPLYVLTVEDNGVGIAPDVLPLLPQSWLSTKGEDHLGLGLASIDESLQAYPGCGISFASKHHKWTRVTVKMPLFYT